jgi:hypothetical protein
MAKVAEKLDAERTKAMLLVKQWDASGQPKTSAYYRILGIALGR